MQECRNFQSSLNLQQTYSMALCSHVNNIYNKLAEIQQQLPHSAQHMNTGDMIQIEAPDFDPDTDEALPSQDHQEAQGSANIIQQSPKDSHHKNRCFIATRHPRRRHAGHDPSGNTPTAQSGHRTKYTYSDKMT